MGALFQERFCPQIELLTYQGTNKSLELERGNFSPWLKSTLNISTSENYLMVYLGPANTTSMAVLKILLMPF